MTPHEFSSEADAMEWFEEAGGSWTPGENNSFIAYLNGSEFIYVDIGSKIFRKGMYQPSLQPNYIPHGLELVDSNGEELKVGYTVFDKLSGQDATIYGADLGRNILIQLFTTGEIVETKSKYVKKLGMKKVVAMEDWEADGVEFMTPDERQKYWADQDKNKKKTAAKMIQFEGQYFDIHQTLKSTWRTGYKFDEGILEVEDDETEGRVIDEKGLEIGEGRIVEAMKKEAAIGIGSKFLDEFNSNLEIGEKTTFEITDDNGTEWTFEYNDGSIDTMDKGLFQELMNQGDFSKLAMKKKVAFWSPQIGTTYFIGTNGKKIKPGKKYDTFDETESGTRVTTINGGNHDELSVSIDGEAFVAQLVDDSHLKLIRQAAAIPVDPNITQEQIDEAREFYVFGPEFTDEDIIEYMKNKKAGAKKTAAKVEFNGQIYDATQSEVYDGFYKFETEDYKSLILDTDDGSVHTGRGEDTWVGEGRLIEASKHTASGDEKTVPDNKLHLQQVDEVESPGDGPSGGQTTAPGMQFYTGAAKVKKTAVSIGEKYSDEKAGFDFEVTGIYDDGDDEGAVVITYSDGVDEMMGFAEFAQWINGAGIKKVAVKKQAFSNSIPQIGSDWLSPDGLALSVDDKLNSETYEASDESGTKYEIKSTATGWQAVKLGHQLVKQASIKAGDKYYIPHVGVKFTVISNDGHLAECEFSDGERQDVDVAELEADLEDGTMIKQGSKKKTAGLRFIDAFSGREYFPKEEVDKGDYIAYVFRTDSNGYFSKWAEVPKDFDPSTAHPAQVYEIKNSEGKPDTVKIVQASQYGVERSEMDKAETLDHLKGDMKEEDQVIKILEDMKEEDEDAIQELQKTAKSGNGETTCEFCGKKLKEDELTNGAGICWKCMDKEFGEAKKTGANEFKVGDKVIHNNAEEDYSEEFIIVSIDRDVIVCQSTEDDSPGAVAEFGIYDPNITRVGSKKTAKKWKSDGEGECELCGNWTQVDSDGYCKGCRAASDEDSREGSKKQADIKDELGLTEDEQSRKEEEQADEQFLLDEEFGKKKEGSEEYENVRQLVDEEKVVGSLDETPEYNKGDRLQTSEGKILLVKSVNAEDEWLEADEEGAGKKGEFITFEQADRMHKVASKKVIAFEEGDKIKDYHDNDGKLLAKFTSTGKGRLPSSIEREYGDNIINQYDQWNPGIEVAVIRIKGDSTFYAVPMSTLKVASKKVAFDKSQKGQCDVCEEYKTVYELDGGLICKDCMTSEEKEEYGLTAATKTAGAVKEEIELFKEEMEANIGHEISWEKAQELFNQSMDEPTEAKKKVAIDLDEVPSEYETLPPDFQEFLLAAGINKKDWTSTLDDQDRQGYYDDWLDSEGTQKTAGETRDDGERYRTDSGKWINVFDLIVNGPGATSWSEFVEVMSEETGLKKEDLTSEDITELKKLVKKWRGWDGGDY